VGLKQLTNLQSPFSTARSDNVQLLFCASYIQCDMPVHITIAWPVSLLALVDIQSAHEQLGTRPGKHAICT
jgi:hypothetical protein